MTSRTGPRRIVVGIDGSPPSLTALAWALAWATDEANGVDGEIDAVLAYDTGLAWIDVGSDAETMILDRSAERAEKTLHEALATVTLPADGATKINPIVVAGSPASVLVQRAAEADLLVVGTRGRGGFAGLLLGSVSQRCAERSTCPVVIVPTRRVPDQEGADA